MSDDSHATWGDHQWLQPTPRRLELESGGSVFHRRCTRCGRDFAIDRSTGVRHAIQVSIFSLHRLHDEVTQRWLAEGCPGERLPADEDDRKRRDAELRISWDRSRDQIPTLVIRRKKA
jgi:hypothetical protein